MLHQNSPSDCTSAEFEKAAIKRFRTLALCIPSDCKVFREPWGNHTVVCLDFQACPNQLEITKKKAHLLIKAAQELGLAQSVIFRVEKKVMGWKKIPAENYTSKQ